VHLRFRRLPGPAVLARVLAGIVGLAVLAAVLSAGGRAPSSLVQKARQRVGAHLIGHARPRTAANQQSRNWSGYVRAGFGITRATGAWHVPTLRTSYDGYSSTWVGIDGATSNDGYLIQTGTEADVIGGRAHYAAWWEVITPSDLAPETRFASLTIHAGDSISASVTKNASGTWTMRLTDNTTGHSASHTQAFAGRGASAEWIQEDTDVDGYISPAPDWQSVTFTRITLNGANPRLSAVEALDIVDAHGTREDVTSAPTASRSGFTVRWLAPGTRTKAS
jgi:hypothetical protein